MDSRINPRLLKSELLRRCRLEECRAACCLHGVWIDALEAQDIRRHAHLISAFMPPGFEDPGTWFDERQEPDLRSLSGQVVHSAVLEASWHYGGTACVFLRKDFRCALQAAAEAAGEDAWRFKPYYCILHPLDIDEQGRITLDENEALLDEPGSCLRPAEREIPLLATFEPELRHLLGDRAYQRLLEETMGDHLP